MMAAKQRATAHRKTNAGRDEKKKCQWTVFHKFEGLQGRSLIKKSGDRPAEYSSTRLTLAETSLSSIALQERKKNENETST